MFTLSTVLERVERHRNKTLINDTAWQKIVDLSRDFPSQWTYTGYECRLESDAPRVDLMLGIGSEQARQTIRQNWRTNRGYGVPFGAQPFIEQWAQTPSILADCPVINFEWDIPDDTTPTKDTIKPLMAICLNPSIYDANYQAKPRYALIRLIKAALPLIIPPLQVNSILTTILHCVDHLPANADLVHIMPLHSRGINQCTLLIDIKKDKLHEWLKQIRWPGDYQALNTILSLSNPHSNNASIQIHVGEQVSGYIGIESPLSIFGQLYNFAPEVLARLHQQNLACKSKIAAIQDWPTNYKLLSADKVNDIHLSHDCYFKLASTGKEQPIKAKAYLEVITQF